MNDLELKVDGLPFLDKLILVCERGELDFWENRLELPNLSRDEFEQVLKRVEQVDNLRWPRRGSRKGSHGKTGENYCFKFNCSASFGGIFEIETRFYFVKGYFFNKGDLKGVTIQSFRED